MKLHFVNENPSISFNKEKKSTEYALNSSNMFKYQKDLMTPFRKKDLKSILEIV